MSHVSIIGTGNMGQAIAAVAGRGGHTVQLLGEADSATPVSGDIVVLAVPYPAVSAVIAERGEQPRRQDRRRHHQPPELRDLRLPDRAVRQLRDRRDRRRTPQSNVLKAFNTTFAATLAAGSVGPLTTTVLIAGDDVDAKSTLAGVITSGGLKAIDAGGLQRARELESLGFLQIGLAAKRRSPGPAASASSPEHSPMRTRDSAP